MSSYYQILLFCRSKKIVLDARKRGKVDQHKRQKKYHNTINDEIKAHIQSENDYFFNTRLENINSDDNKIESFKIDEANSKSWVEDALKKLSKNNRSIAATFMEEMIKEVHSAPQSIRATINVKKL